MSTDAPRLLAAAALAALSCACASYPDRTSRALGDFQGGQLSKAQEAYEDPQTTGSPFLAAAGTLEYFVTERYCLYHLNHRGTPYRLEIHHPPWPLQPAEGRFTANTMAEAAGISLSAPPLLHFSKRQDMVAWLPTRL